ncbi:Ribosome association toxin PasT (RatA) of the RatAB toxin-antitoxin module [Saccharopolyspora shandongensis]|uniref:Ribosome association toxin PasT (RatA) of the RatAB toxin-antitoxin module n=1 Tax=Saccharopolyspora shandongensis TaxID=418495 RepID=A0A1H3SIV3_9PSEU|nr:SRPBCC family protein [Saccharopolyspora shandongensis]SDZ37993.1 Ribosome association toxin PasT (RatA) of the RatAB toxin-antitoxin module [Saccharopolyspora shandongensis]
MPTVTVESLVPAAMGADAATVFSAICDVERFADQTDEVRSVTVTARQDGTQDSEWAVTFRNGILCWSERDRIDHSARTITFQQLDGDFERFDGEWAVDEFGPDTIVRFTAHFDLGMPSLAAIIDPIAEEALRASIQAILRGLLGEELVFLDTASHPVASDAETPS